MSKKRLRSGQSAAGEIRNWAIRDNKGRTRVVIEAASAASAASRVATLLLEHPPIPRRFEVAEHEGPVQSSWYGDSWFRLREDIDRAGLDAESRFLRKRPVPASCVSGRGSVTAGMVRALPAQGHRSGGELISSMNSPSS